MAERFAEAASDASGDDMVLRLMETTDIEGLIEALRARLHARSSAYAVQAMLREYLAKNKK